MSKISSKGSAEPEGGQDLFGMAARAVGEDRPAQRQGQKTGAQLRVGAEPAADIDVVDIFEIILGIDRVVADQSLQGGAVGLPVVAAQPVDLPGGDGDDLLHVAVDALVDQRENLPLGGIEGIVEIEENGVHGFCP